MASLSHFPMPMAPFNTWNLSHFVTPLRSFTFCASLSNTARASSGTVMAMGEVEMRTILDLLGDEDDGGGVGGDVQYNETRCNRK